MGQPYHRTKVESNNLKLIPFLRQFRAGVLQRAISRTTRSIQYGGAGDDLRIGWGDAKFPPTFIRLLRVFEISLGRVARLYWPDSGVESEAQYIDVWRRLHSGNFNPDRRVWMHRFRLLNRKELNRYEY